MNNGDATNTTDEQHAALAHSLGLAPSVAIAYRSACAYLGRKPDGKGRRRVIAEAQGVLRRRQLHERGVRQAKVVKARREQERQPQEAAA